MEKIPHYAAAPPHLPVILTGLSGGGKSTVATMTQQYARTHLPPERQISLYDGRATTRPLRPGEQEGIDGMFDVPRQKLSAMAPDIFFQYDKYDETYAFLRGRLRDCLRQGDTFVVGGEPDTALRIRNAINSPAEREALRLPSLKAVTLYVRRPLRELLLGIVERSAYDGEKLRRIEHVLRKDAEADKEAATADYLVQNGKDRLNTAVFEVLNILQSERTKQLSNLFGTSYDSAFFPPDYVPQHS